MSGRHQGQPLPEEGFILLREPLAKGAGHTAIGPMSWDEVNIVKPALPIGETWSTVRLSQIATALRYPQ